MNERLVEKVADARTMMGPDAVILVVGRLAFRVDGEEVTSVIEIVEGFWKGFVKFPNGGI